MMTTWTEEQATVFVVDDDAAVRNGLKVLLESAGLRMEAFPSAQAFLDGFDGSRGGCVVLDVRMPGMSGLELQERLVKNGHQIPIIFITGHGDIPMAVRAVQNGAIDFLEKPFRGPTLLERVQQAIRRDLQQRTENARHALLEERLARLTPREKQVMERVVSGRPNKQIAAEFGVSIKAVEAHRARVMRKMQAESLAELVQMVMYHQNAGEPQSPRAAAAN